MSVSCAVPGSLVAVSLVAVAFSGLRFRFVAWLQWDAAVHSFHQVWAFVLASAYSAAVGVNWKDFGVDVRATKINDFAAHDADLKTVEESISPAQEGILLWMLTVDRLPSANVILSGNSAGWSALAEHDRCQVVAKEARQGRIARLAKAKSELRSLQRAGSFGFMYLGFGFTFRLRLHL